MSVEQHRHKPNYEDDDETGFDITMDGKFKCVICEKRLDLIKLDQLSDNND